MMRPCAFPRPSPTFLIGAWPCQPKQDLVTVGAGIAVLAFLEGEMGRCGVSVQRQCAPGLFVHGDKDLLYRAFYNILVNGQQAMEGPGTVRIVSRAEPDGRVCLEFLDPGPGFDPAILPNLLDPFLYHQGWRHRAGPAHCAVHYHQPRRVNRAGERSRRRCAGARAVAEGHTRAREDVMSEKAHILVIDDEKNYLLVLQTLLEDEGYTVTAISDPKQPGFSGRKRSGCRGHGYEDAQGFGAAGAGKGQEKLALHSGADHDGLRFY